MISQIISHTVSLWYLHQLILSSLHNKILIENQLINAQIFSLFKSFEEIETLISIRTSTSYSNLQKLSSTNNTFLNKKTTRSFTSENSTQNDSEGKQKIFSIKKVFDRAAEAKKEKRKVYHRGSKFRGVSRNGGKWQVLIMINRQKNYIGNYDTEEEAARIYDQVAIKYHKEKARTNFQYEGILQAQQ